MEVSVNTLCVFLCSVICCVYCCGAVEVEEGPCWNPHPKAADFNFSILAKQTNRFYHALWSKYELWHTVADISGKSIESLAEEDITKACPMLENHPPTSYRYEGYYNGRVTTADFDLTGFDPDRKSLKWVVRENEKVGGESWITKGGNNYAVFVTCWTSGQRSFAVSSTVKKLSPETKLEVVEHLKSLGFNPKFFWEYNYANCDKNNDHMTSREKNEL